MIKLHTHSARKIPTSYSMISAGPGIQATEDFYMLDIMELITGGREGFVAYQVTGYSQSPHIQPGYLIWVDTWAEPRNGHFVAAAINGEVCVKVFQNTQAYGLRLVSKNEEHKPRIVSPHDAFVILGVVRGHVAIYS